MLENMFTALISNCKRASLLYITASRILFVVFERQWWVGNVECGMCCPRGKSRVCWNTLELKFKSTATHDDV